MHRFFQGNRKMALFLGTLTVTCTYLFLLFVFFPQTTHAAPPSCAWISDRTIRCSYEKGVSDGAYRNDRTTDFVDSNPNDTNRTFKSLRNFGNGWCKNNPTEAIYMGSTPSSATLVHVIDQDPKEYASSIPHLTPDDCKTKNASISLSGVSSAIKPSTDCEARPGSQLDACVEDLLDGNAAFARNCGGPYPSTGGICTGTPAPQPPDPDGNPTENAEGKEPDPCDSLGNDFSLRWIACPVLTAGTGMADGLDGLIEENLHYDTNIFDEGTAQGKGFKQAWGAFRSIALALVLIAGLIMIVSQGAGLGIVDAYTIRKVLPRLLVAVIGITLSWELLAFIITFFNDMGHWIQDLILLPFQAAAGGGDSGNPLASVAGALTAAVIGTGATAAYLIALGPLGILSLVGTVILALLVGWLVLVVRSVVITIIILFAPLAFACYILPNTKKVWDFWQNALITMLMVFPIIMALLAAGKAMSIVSDNGLMKVIFLIAPYFFVPFAFKLAGGLMSTVFSMVNDKGRGGFDRLRNVRSNQMKQRFDDAVNMRQNNMVARTGMGQVARRLQNANNGGLSFTKRGRAQYASKQSRIAQAAAAKALENDHGMSAGDDLANSLALDLGMNKDRFIREYAAEHRSFMAKKGVNISQQEATDAAYKALGGIEAGYGAQLGTSAMAVAAFKAKAASSTSYQPGDWNAIANDAAQLMDKGLLNEADVMMALKANKARTDISGVGSSTILAKMTDVRRRYQTDPSNKTLINNDERSALLQDALFGSQPGAIVAGRHEAVEALAPEMLRRLDQVKRTGTEAEYIKELAAVAGQYDVMSQVSRQNAEKMDTHLMAQEVTDGFTVQQEIEKYRGSQAFQERRREYQQQAQAQATAAAAALAQGQPPGQVQQPTIPGL